MKFKSILNNLPFFDFYVKSKEDYVEFLNAENTSFYNLKGEDLVKLYLNLSSKTNSFFSRKKTDYAKRVFNKLQLKVIEENRQELEQMLMEKIECNENNILYHLLDKKIKTKYPEIRKSKPNPGDFLLDLVTNPYQKLKTNKLALFFSEFGRYV